MTHTLTPWYATDRHVQSIEEQDNYICKAEGNTPDQAKCNAAFIAKACNNFDGLYDALEWLLEWGEPTDTYCEFCDTHAPKATNKLGIQYEPVIGNIPHTEECPRKIAEQALDLAKAPN